MKLMIDPPYGWKYGFPKPLPNDAYFEVNQHIGVSDTFDIKSWLVAEGYPSSEINFFGKHFYYRTWEQTDDTN